MRVLLCLLVGFLLFGCQHHLVGQKVQPHHRLDDSGHYSVNGGWVAIDYDYAVDGDSLKVDGTVSFTNAGDKFENAHKVQMLLTFFFLDDQGIVLKAETERMAKGGDTVDDKKFHFTFPYKKEYQSVGLEFRLSAVTD